MSNYLTLDQIADSQTYTALGLPAQAKQALRMAYRKNFPEAVKQVPKKGSGVGYVLVIDVEHPAFTKWFAEYLIAPRTKGRLAKQATDNKQVETNE